MERAELVARAVDFLVRVMDEDVPLDEALNALSALAEQFQSGAIVGGTLIDSRSATFERVVYPSLLASPFSTIRHVPISSPIFGTCAKAARKEELLLEKDELQKVWLLRKALSQLNPVEAMELLLDKLKLTKTNKDFLNQMNQLT